jgi:flagellar hook assembly protein FlgD
MKNVLKTISVAAFSLFLLHQNALAIDPVETKSQCKNNTCEKFKIGMYRVRDSETMNLLVEKQKGERLFIRLTDHKGKLLHEEVVGRSIMKFGKKLNFSQMQDGNYTLEVSDENEKVVKNIFLSTNEVREVNRLLVGLN